MSAAGEATNCDSPICGVWDVLGSRIIGSVIGFGSSREVPSLQLLLCIFRLELLQFGLPSAGVFLLWI